MLHDVIAGWADWMAAMAWQAAALVGVALVLDAFLRRLAWPHLRHALWLLVAAKLVLPPTLTSPVGVVGLATRPIPTAMPTAPPPTLWPTMLFVAWAAGVLGFGALLIIRVLRARRMLRGLHTSTTPNQVLALRRAARKLGVNNRRLPRLAILASAPGPAVVGLWRPTIVLPADETLEEAELEHVLMHELAHVRRRDLWIQAAFGLLNLLYWFHPGVWLARRRAHAARELCCDATVAAALGEGAPAYRRTLLHYAARRHGLIVPGSAAFLPGASTLLARLSALERGSWRHPGARRAVTAVLILMLATTVLPMAPAVTRTLRAPSELEAAAAAVDRVLKNPGAYGSIEKQMAVRRYLALKNSQD